MTTPLDGGGDPDRPGERRGLESYPEFFAYPIDPDVHETAHIPRLRGDGTPRYQQPHTSPERLEPPEDGPDAEIPARAMYPQPYIKEKAAEGSAADDSAPAPQAQAPQAQAQIPQMRRTAPRPLASFARSVSTDPPAAFAPRSRGAAPTRPPAQASPNDAPASYALPQTPPPAQAAPAFSPTSEPQQASPAPLPQMPPPAQASSTFSLPSEHAHPSPAVPPASQASVPPLPPPKPPRPRTPGRRRAKRSLRTTLWPFQAFSRPAAAANSPRIRSRSTTATVWRKLRADRAAVLGGWTIVVLVLLAVFAPVVAGVFGVTPNALHPELTDATFGPHGFFGGISWSHPLGVDQRMGRDIMARLLFGARVSLLIAGGATLLSVALGVGLGVVSGYLGGRVDMVVMRLADLFLAFPLMLFALGLTGALSDQAFGLSGNALRIAIMIFVMGFFNWPYIARIVRAEVLSLREREFVDAARAMGATTRWIVWRELMPNLLAPILVYTTLLIPANIIFEAGLSALGIGLNPPASSWGQMMTDAVATVYTDPEYLIVPGMAVFITVLAFNLFGDGLRNATDPTAQ